MALDAAVIGLYFLIVIGLGFWYRRRAARSLESYFLAGKRLHWSVLAASGAVSTFDITGTMWMVSMLVLLGMKSWWHHWMWGVMLPAFALAYMARWVRRSRVMTGAEWMVTRFGEDRGGRAARRAYALMAVVTQAAFIGYAFQGIGKFAAVYIPLKDVAPHLPFGAAFVAAHEAQILALLIFAVTTLYVVLGGLYSVVITDAIQTAILSGAGLLIAFVAYTHLTPEAIEHAVPGDFASIWPPWRIGDPAAIEKGYELFGLLVIVWVLKGFLMNAGGPAQMYDFQRYLAARDARDAAKIGASWPFFLIVRWAMVAGITLLAATGALRIADPEKVMPRVLQEYLRPGVRGLVIAGLLAAFMSTFSSTVNSGASYLIRDLWQPLFRPAASERRLIRHSYIATAGIVVLGAAIGLQVKSIKEIWDWMMMVLGAGVVIPNFLRWHWWRLNGWGYAAGLLVGLGLSLVPIVVEGIPLYASFPAICAGSLAASLAVTRRTPPTDRAVLRSFFRAVRPFGLWGPIAAETEAGTPSPAESFPRIALNTAIAILGITCLYLGPMYLVGHWHGRAGICFGIAAVSGAVLYFTWYRALPPRAAGRKAPIALDDHGTNL